MDADVRAPGAASPRTSERRETPLVERTVPGLHASLIGQLPPAHRVRSVLDIGCGSGAWLSRLRQAGYRGLVGMDRDTSQFKVADVPVVRGDLDSDGLLFADGSFDLICAIELVEHLQNPGCLFLHGRRLLSEEGRMLVTTPNVESVVARLRFLLTGKLKQFDDKGDPTHVSPIIETCLRRMLAVHGLEIERRWQYPADGSSLTTRPMLRILSRCVGWVVPGSREGDVACFLVRRRAGPPPPGPR